MMRRLQDLARAARAAAQQGTRAFTNVPAGEVAIANEAPRLGDHKVFITAVARTAAQQGMVLTVESGAPVWRIELENTTSKWMNPLMGWTATSDALENVQRSNLVFQTKEAAMAFAEKNGWSYEVQEPHLRKRQRPKRYQGYGDNFNVKRKGLPVGGLLSEAQEKKG